MRINEALLKDLFLNWNTMTMQERLKVARRFEEEHSQQQHRKPARIITDQNINHTGIFRGSINTIFIKPMLLRLDNSYGLLSVLLHEGRHAYQHDQINKKNSKALDIWRINLSISGYLRHNPDYGLQPVEIDAYCYSLSILRQIYEDVKSRDYSHQDFKRFIFFQQKLLANFIREGRRMYGNHYPEVIEKKILKKHRLFEIAKQRLNRPNYTNLLKLSDSIEKFIATTPNNSKQAFRQLLEFQMENGKTLNTRPPISNPIRNNKRENNENKRTL